MSESEDTLSAFIEAAHIAAEMAESLLRSAVSQDRAGETLSPPEQIAAAHAYTALAKVYLHVADMVRD